MDTDAKTTNAKTSLRDRTRSWTTYQWTIAIIVVLVNLIGQAMQNICLPLALSKNDNMAVVLVYMCFTYFWFFAILDVILESFVGGPVKMTLHGGNRAMLNVGVQNTLNGIGAIFGGSSERTPITMQMSSSLLVNTLAPFFKLWVFGIPRRQFQNRRWFYVTGALFAIAFTLTVIDKAQHKDGAVSWFCLFFIGGTIFGMTYNVYQDKMMMDMDTSHLSYLQSMKLATQVLRRQLTWLFLLSWSAVLIAWIPGADQSKLTADNFLQSWGDFLAFGNLPMNLFNLGYLMCFISSVFINKFDSAFNMLLTNISAVSAMWTGWVPSLAMQTVGFVPSYSLLIPAILVSILAIVPAYWCSTELRHVLDEHLSQSRSLSDKSGNNQLTNGGPFVPLMGREDNGMSASTGITVIPTRAAVNVNTNDTHGKATNAKTPLLTGGHSICQAE